MGKSTIAKAVLNEKPIVTRFDARLFITYDGIGLTAMTYQTFLDQIAEALRLPSSTSATPITQHLQTIKALLVIDNAETFLGAPENDRTSIYRVLEEIGSYPATRIIVTTRNTETIPLNLPWHRVHVTGLDAKAAHQAFNAVYPMDPIDSRVAEILSDLGHHPLCINLLANAAVMNSWDATQLQKAWKERQTDVLHLAESDKNRSLPATINLSIASFKSRPIVLQILQTIAFLPQGVDNKDLHSIFPSIPDISRQTEAILRSSLIYQKGTRLTMLPPIRMYIADRYNRNLPYDSPVLADARIHYHGKLFNKPYSFVEHEHGNIDRFMHFDMSSDLYRTNVEIHALVLRKAEEFLLCTIEVVQRSSLWPLLVSESQESSYNQVDALAQLIILCLTHTCRVDYRRYQYDDALVKVDIAEKYCRDRGSACDEQLVRCLRLRGEIFERRGDLIVAAQALKEGLSIAKSRDDSLQEALLNDDLADVLLSQGKVTEAEHLFMSAQEYYESNSCHSHLLSLLISRGDISIFQKNFSNARILLSKSMELDRQHTDGRFRLHILSQEANCDGWARDFSASKRILDEATNIEIGSGTPKFRFYMEALRGKAYYEARLGKLDDARRTIADAVELEQESGGNSRTDFISACIELLSYEGRHSAESMLQMIVDQDRESEKKFTVICRRALGEAMRLNGKPLETKAQFEKAKVMCDVSGMSPRHLYVHVFHWYSLPEEYDGWTRYLDGYL